VKCNFITKWMNHVSDDDCSLLPADYCSLKSDTRPMLCDGENCILMRLMQIVEAESGIDKENNLCPDKQK